MKKIQWDIEIRMAIPSSKLIYFPDQNNNEYFENESFKAIRNYLNIEIDIQSWYNRCIQIGFGKLHLQRIELYYSKDENSYILLDNYYDKYDQLGLITIGVKTSNKLGFELRKFTRIFNDESTFNVSYEEGSNAIFKRYPIDDKTRMRYREPQESEYLNGKEIKTFGKVGSN